MAGNSRGNLRTTSVLVTVVKVFMLCAAFTIGIQVGLSHHPVQYCRPESENWVFDESEIDRKVQERIDAELYKGLSKAEEGTKEKKPRFSKETKDFVVGAAKIPKSEFNDNFDFGLPKHPKGEEDSEVLLFYTSNKSLPKDEKLREAVVHTSGGDVDDIPLLGAHQATENCYSMNTIVTNLRDTKKCIALAGNYESFHVQKWARNGPESTTDKKLDPKYPLRHVGRGLLPNGRNEFEPPEKFQIEKHWKRLQLYFNNLEETKKKLQPILGSIAKDKAVVVMVCNLGQSILLQNYVCNAHANDMYLGNVIVFATDPETYKIAQGLGLNAFYDEKNFENIPTHEAKKYGDRTFASMMYAKVLSVQLVNMLGYNVLFQDVDVVWYKDPLAHFQNKESELQKYDVLFQDDGSRQERFAPYYANTGFYYVRSNELTKYLFTSLLYSADMIIKTGSHQAVMNTLLIEHTSLYGLKVKTLPGEDFPGGSQYHNQPDYMRSIIEKKFEPFIFHMCWTENKDNKILFMEQMGQWHVKSDCSEEKAIEMIDKYKDKQKPLVYGCCSEKPLIQCHYRDKPSAIPCKKSPPIDEGRKSFW